MGESAGIGRSDRWAAGWLFALAAWLPGAGFAETVLITGANSGIGLEFTNQYADKGWTVIATHRRSSLPDTLAEVIAEHQNVVVERMDVTSAGQIEALAAKLAGAVVKARRRQGVEASVAATRLSQVLP